MRRIILVVFSAIALVVKASDEMGKDSTDLVPIDPMTMVPPVTITTTANGTMPGTITYTPQCGPSDNSFLPSAPTSFLCNSGQPSVVNVLTGRRGTETYLWSCTGNNPADPNNVVQCSAQKKVLGTCGSADGMTLSGQPTASEMCATGSPTGYTENGTQATWSCDGTPYTIPANCSATIQPPMSFCGSAQGQTYSAPPSPAELCISRYNEYSSVPSNNGVTISYPFAGWRPGNSIAPPPRYNWSCDIYRDPSAYVGQSQCIANYVPAIDGYANPSAPNAINEDGIDLGASNLPQDATYTITAPAGFSYSPNGSDFSGTLTVATSRASPRFLTPHPAGYVTVTITSPNFTPYTTQVYVPENIPSPIFGNSYSCEQYYGPTWHGFGVTEVIGTHFSDGHNVYFADYGQPPLILGTCTNFAIQAIANQSRVVNAVTSGLKQILLFPFTLTNK